jgi:hypothetical protein
MAAMPVDLADVGEPGWDMTTDAPAKSKRETWLDWQPPDAPEPEQLLTKGQLLDELRKMGEHIPERTLNHWQSLGMIPRPVRRWHAGKPASFYAEWVVEAVVRARDMRRDGSRPADIGRSLRSWVVGQVSSDRHINVDDTLRLGAHDDLHLRRDDSPAAAAYATALATALDAIKALADARERWTGVPVHRARLQLFDEHGQRDDHWWHISPAPDAE